MNTKFVIEYPENKAPCAAVVIAPGFRYPKNGSIFLILRDFFLAKGIAVARLDWSFYVDDAVSGVPSEELRVETAELQGLISLLRVDRRIDASRIFLLGKSLGSVIAWRVFCEDAAVAGVVLVTPLCQENTGHYPALTGEERPVLLIAGSEDPNTDLRAMHVTGKRLSQHLQLYIVMGNHTLTTAKVDYENELSRRIAGIGSVIYSWLVGI